MGDRPLLRLLFLVAGEAKPAMRAARPALGGLSSKARTALNCLSDDRSVSYLLQDKSPVSYIGNFSFGLAVTA
jgi:hypothetical protein